MATKKASPPSSGVSIISDSGSISANSSGISILGNNLTVSSGDQDPKTEHATHDRNLVEHMPRFRESPLDFIRDIGLHVSGSGWRSYDNVIGQPIFYSGFTENMINAVMATPMLKAKISELAEKRVKVEEEQGLFGEVGLLYQKRRSIRRAELEASLHEVATKMTDDMVCKMESKRFIRGAYYFATALLTRAYNQGKLSRTTRRVPRLI